MIKTKVLSPPDKQIKTERAPYIAEGFDNMLRRSLNGEARRLLSVQTVTSSFQITEDFRKNYELIDWHRSNNKMLMI